MLKITSKCYSQNLVTPAFAQVFQKRAFSEEQGKLRNTVEEFKEAAKKSGDAAKEWMLGTKEKASKGLDERPADAKDRLMKGTARAAESMARRSTGNATASNDQPGGNKGVDSALGGPGAKISETVGAFKDKVEETMQNKDEGQKPGFLKSARAEFEKSHPSVEEKSNPRKSQLVDLASGDEPKEKRAREDKRILPNEFYTRH